MSTRAERQAQKLADEVRRGQYPMFEIRLVDGLVWVLTLGGGSGWRWIANAIGVLILPPRGPGGGEKDDPWNQ